MTEESLETTDLKEQIEQGVERALENDERRMPSWTMYLSLSTAIIAVFAAVASLESGANSNDAILEKNEAVLNQSKASDQWAFYQAKGVKGSVAAGAAEIVAASDPKVAERLNGEASRYKREQVEIETAARSLESKVLESNRRADRYLDRHHRFAISVTLFQIAIALHAIAALTRRKILWFGGLIPSVAGLGIFIRGVLSTL